MDSSITVLLDESRNGNDAARDELWPLMYHELRRLALHHMHDQRHGHTLQATALVNEGFIKLGNIEYSAECSREFFSLAASAMRSILVDYARARNRDKRGANAEHVPLTETLLSYAGDVEGIIDVDRALDQMASKDKRMATIAEMRIFGGLSFDEIASALDISNSTARTDMRFAKAWLKSQLES